MKWPPSSPDPKPNTTEELKENTAIDLFLLLLLNLGGYTKQNYGDGINGRHVQKVFEIGKR
jgi:hypothetical protein